MLIFDLRLAGRATCTFFQALGWAEAGRLGWSSGPSARRLVAVLVRLGRGYFLFLKRKRKYTKKKNRAVGLSVCMFVCRDPFRGSSTHSHTHDSPNALMYRLLLALNKCLVVSKDFVLIYYSPFIMPIVRIHEILIFIARKKWAPDALL